MLTPAKTIIYDNSNEFTLTVSNSHLQTLLVSALVSKLTDKNMSLNLLILQNT